MPAGPVEAARIRWAVVLHRADRPTPEPRCLPSSLGTQAGPGHSSGFINVHAADIAKACQERPARDAKFLTEPTDHGLEIRACPRDPDGHLIEVGQATALLD